MNEQRRGAGFWIAAANDWIGGKHARNAPDMARDSRFNAPMRNPKDFYPAPKHSLCLIVIFCIASFWDTGGK